MHHPGGGSGIETSIWSTAQGPGSDDGSAALGTSAARRTAHGWGAEGAAVVVHGFQPLFRVLLRAAVCLSRPYARDYYCSVRGGGLPWAWVPCCAATSWKAGNRAEIRGRRMRKGGPPRPGSSCCVKLVINRCWTPMSTECGAASAGGATTAGGGDPAPGDAGRVPDLGVSVLATLSAVIDVGKHAPSISWKQVGGPAGAKGSTKAAQGEELRAAIAERKAGMQQEFLQFVRNDRSPPELMQRLNDFNRFAALPRGTVLDHPDAADGALVLLTGRVRKRQQTADAPPSTLAEGDVRGTLLALVPEAERGAFRGAIVLGEGECARASFFDVTSLQQSCSRRCGLVLE